MPAQIDKLLQELRSDYPELKDDPRMDEISELAYGEEEEEVDAEEDMDMDMYAMEDMDAMEDEDTDDPELDRKLRKARA